MQREGMIPDLVTHLSSEDPELRKHVALAIFKVRKLQHTSEFCWYSNMIEVRRRESDERRRQTKRRSRPLGGDAEGWDCHQGWEQ